VLQMQHLQGIHMYMEEASRAGLLGSRAQRGKGVGCTTTVRWMGLTLRRTPTIYYIGIPNRPLGLRPISSPKPNPILIQSELGFQPLKCATL
jgi:hypothetical protein